MPRPKGATNKPKDDSILIEELKKRGYHVSKDQRLDLQPTAHDLPSKDVDDDKVKNDDPATSKTVLTIKTPKTKDKPARDPDRYYCGNTACNYSSKTEFSQCPRCHIVNTF